MEMAAIASSAASVAMMESSRHRLIESTSTAAASIAIAGSTSQPPAIAYINDGMRISSGIDTPIQLSPQRHGAL